jgi:hypothetical protein
MLTHRGAPLQMSITSYNDSFVIRVASRKHHPIRALHVEFGLLLKISSQTINPLKNSNRNGKQKESSHCQRRRRFNKHSTSEAVT